MGWPLEARQVASFQAAEAAIAWEDIAQLEHDSDVVCKAWWR